MTDRRPVAALVLAPFFVHFEILFKLGYNSRLQKGVHADITAEIQKIKAAEKNKKKE